MVLCIVFSVSLRICRSCVIVGGSLSVWGGLVWVQKRVLC